MSRADAPSEGAATAEPSFLRLLAAGVGQLVRRDRLTQAALATAAVLAAIYLSGVADDVQSPPFYRLAVAILTGFLPFAALIGPPAEEERDRIFWRLLLWSMLAMWLMALMRVIQGPAGELNLTTPQALASVIAEIVRPTLTVLVLLAVSVRPHEITRQRVADVERSLRLTTVLTFTLGLLAYSGVVPILLDGDLVRQREIVTLALLPIHVWTVLSIFLFALAPIRLRWRATYLLLGSALATFTLSSMRLIPTRAAHDAAFFAEMVACVLALLAMRIRLCRFPAEPLPSPMPATDEVRRNPGNWTLLLAAMIPLGHLAGHRLGLFDPDLREPREIVVIFWMLALAILAAIQHRIAQRFVAELLQERRRVESVLTRHERDFLVASERRNNELALRRQLERFARAFRAGPFGLMITTTDNGVLLEVNDLFLERIGYRREELIGRGTLEMNLWAEPLERNHFVELLTKNGRVDNYLFTFRRADGALHRGLVSAVPLVFQDRPCILTVGRDLTAEEREAERRLQVLDAILDCPIPIAAMLEPTDIAIWNDAMKARLGLDVAQARQRELHQILGPEVAAACLTRPEFRELEVALPGETATTKIWVAAADSWHHGHALLVFLPESR